ncbi:MAG: glucuronate isomerase [Acidimicrobiales bacterium]
MHEDRLLPSEPGVRRVARALYEQTRSLPIVSPHGHCDPSALVNDAAPGDPAHELITKDHYILRLLYSHGTPLEALGVRALDDSPVETDDRAVWRVLAEHYHLFRGTPSRLWLDHTLHVVLGVKDPLRAETADTVYDEITSRLAQDDFRARALYDRFGIEFLATTDGAVADLGAHALIRRSGWPGRVVPTFRPDDVIDPERSDFRRNVSRLGELTGADTSTWAGYLDALRTRRASFKEAGATASDHGHPSPATADLPRPETERLFARVTGCAVEPEDAELFRAQMLTEMAAMSMDDGLVMQLHVGSWRDHNPRLAARFGRDIGGDMPRPADFVGSLKPLLDRFGNEPDLTVVVYTLDETTYGRELAPLAGHYPVLRLGPPWWFYDSPQGMRRFYEEVVETAGFANLVGFNDDARSLLTIPARHDVARRVHAGFLARLVAEHRMDETDAVDVAHDLAYHLARTAFRIAP